MPQYLLQHLLIAVTEGIRVSLTTNEGVGPLTVFVGGMLLATGLLETGMGQRS